MVENPPPDVIRTRLRNTGAGSQVNARLAELSQQVRHLTRLVSEMHALTGPFGVPMPGGRMLVQSLRHVKYLIDPNDLVMAPQLIVYRQWEPELTALFGEILTPESVLVDVGANFGYFTCLGGSLIGPSGGGRVFAIEPNPALLDLLKANVAINWSMSPIEIFSVAAADAPGTADLSIPANGAANATLSAPQDLIGMTTLKVDVRSIDSLVPHGLPVHVLKIDVEGHELGVLRGCRRVVEDSPNLVVVMEWSTRQMAEAGYGPGDLLGLINDLGLAAYEAPADGRPSNWTPLPADRLLSLDYANVILSRTRP